MQFNIFLDKHTDCKTGFASLFSMRGANNEKHVQKAGGRNVTQSATQHSQMPQLACTRPSWCN